MILDITGQSININGINFAVGMKVSGTDCSDYSGLEGRIIEIRTDGDMETENKGPDIYCEFDPPETPEGIAELVKNFSALYGLPLKFEDICLDFIIMAPEMLTPINDQQCVFDKSQRLELIVNAMIATGAIKEQPNLTSTISAMTADEFDSLLCRLQNKAYIVWQTEDVMMQLKKEYPLLTEDDAREILNFAIDKHDASVGISWESFEIVAQTLSISKRHKERSDQAEANTPIIIPDDAFEYAGYHFTPYRAFNKGEIDKPLSNDSRSWKKDMNYAMRNMRSDMEMGISTYDWRKADYSNKEFNAASGESKCDIFRCVENGNLYVPGENELFWYHEPFNKKN